MSLQNFKREEQNFVVQNEINNLSFLTGDSKTKMSKVGKGPGDISQIKGRLTNQECPDELHLAPLPWAA